MLLGTRRGTAWLGLLSLSLLALVITTGCDGNPTAAAKPVPFVPADESVAAKPSDSEAVAPSKPEATTALAPADQPDVTPPSSKRPDEALPTQVAAYQAPKAPADKPENPFPRRAPLLEIFDGDIFPRDAEWLNTSGPIRLKDLKGKFVILDFWTYCCINCIHILPELKKLEQKYPNELVVIGVHSAKFDEEKDSENIAAAILRYEIEHPVVNDAEHELWKKIGVSSWPTIVLIDPEGNLVYGRPGEFKAEEFVEILDKAIPFYEKAGLLDRQPLRFDLLAHRAEKTPLRFPGKVLADEAGGRLFITDSNHNRIVVTSLDGKLIDTIGSGAMGKADGDYATATFDHPQGCALVNNMLYVADTQNHLLRKVDLDAKTVTTIAGIGSQARYPWPGLEAAVKTMAIPERWVGKPKETAISSPWALWAHKDQLYIAMAGPHQIWKMPLDESEIGPFAGNGREDIVDGPLMPQGAAALEYPLGFASFAQPSGLSSDGEWLFVADSEGSSIRAVPFDPKKKVRTVVGTNKLSGGRLFEFGDVDGKRATVRLQHPLEVVYHDGTIYVADTYNNKIKAVNAKTGDTKTFAGTGKAGSSDEEATFDEPTGLAYAAGKLYVADTNNHLLRVVDTSTRKVSTLAIEGLTPPKIAKAEAKPDFAGAARNKASAVSLKPVDGQVTLKVALELPEGWKVNPLAPFNYYVEETGDAKLVAPAALGKKSLETPAAEFDVVLPVKPGETQVTVSFDYYYCQADGGGVCKVGSVVFEQPLKIADDAPQSTANLVQIVDDTAAQ